MKETRKKEIREMLCDCSGSCDTGEYFDSLRIFGARLKERQKYLRMSNICSALGSVERLIILKALCEKDRCVCELESILDKAQSTVSYHLRKLQGADLISSYSKNSYSYYHLKEENIKDYLKSLKEVFI